MGFWDLLEGAGKLVEKAEVISNAVIGLSHGNKTKSIFEWDQEWQSIGFLKNSDLTHYNHCVGLYRHVISGQTMYVGRAIELYNGGIRKRLSDYRRDSNSARKHTSGRMINEHLEEIETYILVVGNNEEAINVTKLLEGQFIVRYNPPWNKMLNI